MRTVVVGASSGLGRSIGIGLAREGASVALLARRLDRLAGAAKEAGPGALAIECDVTSEDSCKRAIEEAVKGLGGIDALVYAPGVGPLVRIEDIDAATWHDTFATNVVGASLITAAAIPHLTESAGSAAYLSTVSASITDPWPGLGAYAVTKAALDKLVQAWQIEHPLVGFTRVVVGNCVGGAGESATEFSSSWERGLAGEVHTHWVTRGYITQNFLPVEELVRVVHSVLRNGATTSIPTVVVGPRL